MALAQRGDAVSARLLPALFMTFVAAACRTTSDLPIANDASATAERSTEPLIDAGSADVLRDVSSEECFAAPADHCPAGCAAQMAYALVERDGGGCIDWRPLYGARLRRGPFNMLVDCWVRISDGQQFNVPLSSEPPPLGTFRDCTQEEIGASNGCQRRHSALAIPRSLGSRQGLPGPDVGGVVRQRCRGGRRRPPRTRSGMGDPASPRAVAPTA